MKKTGSCPKCEGNAIERIPGDGQSKNGIPTGLFSWVPVTRYVCMECGFIEEYVDEQIKLQKISKAHKESPR